ncbi:MAG: hypothetical protein ACJATG_001399, partial [Dinoroseobacter sp.]
VLAALAAHPRTWNDVTAIPSRKRILEIGQPC